MEIVSALQSALSPAGAGAERLARLFWVLAAGSAVVWCAVFALTAWAVRARPADRPGRRENLLIVGGALVPTVVLAGLLLYALAMLPGLLARAPAGSLKVAVTGEMWWWRVRYELPDGAFELANELRLPVGEPVELELGSADVLHSFWVPALGGKVDMIPGRRTRLLLEPKKTGAYRGVCAEYCGTAHALMGFEVVVLEKEEFASWLAGQKKPAARPAGALAERGRRSFHARGCAACHVLRGEGGLAAIGPDLTHVGGRRTLGAGILANDASGFARWIARADKEKPDVLMPHFAMLPREELEALAAYLDGLR